MSCAAVVITLHMQDYLSEIAPYNKSELGCEVV